MEKTKYQQLADLAGAYAEAFLLHRSQCNVEAHALLAAAEAYFEAPAMAFRLVSLDDRLESRREQPKQLEVVQGLDGYWYFGLALKFEGSRPGYSAATFTVGLKSSTDEVVVRLSRDLRLPSGSANGRQPVLKEIEDELLQRYRSPAIDKPKPLGFVPR